MPVVLLPGTDKPVAMPATRLKAEVDAGKRVVLPDSDVAISKREKPAVHNEDGADVPGHRIVYLVEPLDADYVEDNVIDPSTDNSSLADEFDSFEEALLSATE